MHSAQGLTTMRVQPAKASITITVVVASDCLAHESSLAAHCHRSKFRLLSLADNLHNPTLSSILPGCGSFPLGHPALSKATPITLHPLDLSTCQGALSALTLKVPPIPPAVFSQSPLPLPPTTHTSSSF